MHKEFSISDLPFNTFIDIEYLKDVFGTKEEAAYEHIGLLTKMMLAKEYYRNSRTTIFSLQKGEYFVQSDTVTIGFFLINLDSITSNNLELTVPTTKYKGFIIGKGGDNINKLKNDINDKLSGIYLKYINIK